MGTGDLCTDKACGTVGLPLSSPYTVEVTMVGAVLPVPSYALVDCTGTSFIFTIKIKVGVFLRALLISVLSGDD
jgi:hypothetical protein